MFELFSNPVATFFFFVILVGVIWGFVDAINR